MLCKTNCDTNWEMALATGAIYIADGLSAILGLYSLSVKKPYRHISKPRDWVL